MPGNTTKRYPDELKTRAVRMYHETRSDHETDSAAMTKVSQFLGIGTVETLRKWIRQAEIDDGDRARLTSQESAQTKQLKRRRRAAKSERNPAHRIGLCG